MIGRWSRALTGAVVGALTTSGTAVASRSSQPVAPAERPLDEDTPMAVSAAGAGAAVATAPADASLVAAPATGPAPAGVTTGQPASAPVVPADPEPPRGREALALGSSLLFLVGAPTIAGGAVAIHNHPPERDGHDHNEPPTNRGSRIFGEALVGIGVATAAVSVVFLALGARRAWRWREWQRRSKRGAWLGPTLTTTRHGTWAAGVRLRF